MFSPRSIIQKKMAQAASTYDAAAVLSRKIADRLFTQLDWMRFSPASILDLGAGTGYITKLLEKRYPYAHIISVDFVKEMLALRADKKSCSVCADATQLPIADNSLDFIVSGLMLPWCENLEAVFAQVQRALKPGGLFLFSTFGPDTLGEMRASWATVDALPHVHGFFDLHDIGDAILRARFADPVMQTEWLTVMYPTMQDLFQDLKKTGAVNLLSDRRMTLTGKKRFQQFLAEYNTYADSAGELPATFEIVYGHCWKSATALKKTTEVFVPISQIKKTH